MPARKTSTTKTLGEDTLVILDLSDLSGAYYVTAADATVNRQDVWYVPEGVTDFSDSKIKLLAEDLPLDEVLTFLAPKVKEGLKSLPTEPSAKKATPAKKAPAKKTASKAAPKPAAKKAPAKKATATKKAPAKRAAKRS